MTDSPGNEPGDARSQGRRALRVLLLHLLFDLLQLCGKGRIQRRQMLEALQFQSRFGLAVQLQAEVGEVEVGFAVVGVATGLVSLVLLAPPGRSLRRAFGWR